MPNLFSLAGRHALVTGASRGLGQAMAVGLAEAGADITITARTLNALGTTAEKIRATGRSVECIALDQSQTDLIVPALNGKGPFDILVNNAGIEQISPSEDVTPALWNRIIDTNLRGSFFTTQAVAKTMLTRGSGAIINLCSLTSYVGVPTAVPYGSSKSGLLGMTRALAAEWAPRGLRVNAIAPGYFRTEMTEAFYEDPQWTKAMLDKIPQRRFGNNDDVVGTVVFLASDASAYVTGQCIGVDGGYLASI
ncbi:glucose 1-dehydrogenase [Falsirhodobacter sp. alg1]|uniref:glucose 1-dehydrogenase n=1 Tax=Falsirhodobacter sp. alg1 TaxID=1472418 RepID=UPI00128F0734|nr:glucose 1-dehydrogenase [Falsirhodobacter sp. alg1]